MASRIAVGCFAILLLSLAHRISGQEQRLQEIRSLLNTEAPAEALAEKLGDIAIDDLLDAMAQWTAQESLLLRDVVQCTPRFRTALLHKVCASRESTLASELLVDQYASSLARIEPWLEGTKARRGRPYLLRPQGLRLRVDVPTDLALSIPELLLLLSELRVFRAPLVIPPEIWLRKDLLAPGLHGVQPAEWFLERQLRRVGLALRFLERGIWVTEPGKGMEEQRELPGNELKLAEALRREEMRRIREAFERIRLLPVEWRGAAGGLLLSSLGIPCSTPISPTISATISHPELPAFQSGVGIATAGSFAGNVADVDQWFPIAEHPLLHGLAARAIWHEGISLSVLPSEGIPNILEFLRARRSPSWCATRAVAFLQDPEAHWSMSALCGLSRCVSEQPLLYLLALMNGRIPVDVLQSVSPRSLRASIDARALFQGTEKNGLARWVVAGWLRLEEERARCKGGAEAIAYDLAAGEEANAESVAEALQGERADESVLLQAICTFGDIAWASQLMEAVERRLKEDSSANLELLEQLLETALLLCAGRSDDQPFVLGVCEQKLQSMQSEAREAVVPLLQRYRQEFWSLAAWNAPGQWLIDLSETGWVAMGFPK